MGTRLELQNKLEELLGSWEVYYQSPGSKAMKYPAIVYSRSRIDEKKANNGKYIRTKQYEIIVIDARPDNPVIDAILDLPYSRYDQQYKSDKLYHDVISLWF